MIIKGVTPSQKNAKRIAINSRTGKPFPITDQRVKDWQESAAWQLKGKKKFKGVVGVEIHITNPNNRSHDLDNQASTILDALVKAEIIEDDGCKFVQELCVYYKGVGEPKAEIEVYNL